MGPAEVKLEQAIHSHPKTPDELTDDMGSLKDSADIPDRWKHFDMPDKTLPAQVRVKVDRLGRALGSGSY